MSLKTFASDNNSGFSPEVLTALGEANQGHMVAYGGDAITEGAIQKIRNQFGKEAEVFFVFNGTGANVLCLKSMTESFQAVICSDLAHINVDECGAPEKFTGCKLLTVPVTDGKLTVASISTKMTGLDDQHHVQPKVISITQSTEVGTVYDLKEIQNLGEFAAKNKLYLHVDGARLSNAAISLQASFKQMTSDAGVHAVSFGGTKNGLLGAEAVVLLEPNLIKNFKFYRKQSMQLSSKMRFIAAQFNAYFTNDLWKRNATASNAMAHLLGSELKKLEGHSSGLKITQKVQSNGVFVKIQKKVLPELLKKTFFYVWREIDAEYSEIRLMCSFDTEPEDVHGLVTAIRNLI